MLRMNYYNALFRKSGSLIWNYQGIQGISFHELIGNSRVVVSKSLFWQILPPISLDFVFFLREFDLKKNSAFMDLEKFHTPKPWCYSPYFWGSNKRWRGGEKREIPNSLRELENIWKSDNPGDWNQEIWGCNDTKKVKKLLVLIESLFQDLSCCIFS